MRCDDTTYLAQWIVVLFFVIAGIIVAVINYREENK